MSLSQASLTIPQAGNGREETCDQPAVQKRSKLSVWIALGLLLGIVCGLLFGDYCGRLKVFGQAYVGLLQMTVLPYLLLSLVAKMGRLDPAQAKNWGWSPPSFSLHSGGLRFC
jgi:Na+/H+-dicarboxylate symporter